MDKHLKDLKQNMDNTILSDLDFKEKNRAAVRSAIAKEQRGQHRKGFNIPYLKYAFSVVASFLFLFGALYYVMNTDQSGKTVKYNTNATHHNINATLASSKQKQVYTVEFTKGVTSDDVKNDIVHRFNPTIQSFTHEYKTSDNQIFRGTYTLNNGESFDQAVKADKENLIKQLKQNIIVLNKKTTSIKQMMNNPKTKGYKGVNQKAINQLDQAIKDRQLLLSQLASKPLAIKTMTIQSTASGVNKLNALSMVSSIVVGDVKNNQGPVKDNNTSQQAKRKGDYINKVDMMNTHDGWATSSNDIIKTSDKGKTWVLVNPKGLDKDTILSSIFLSKKFALVFASTNEGKGNIVLYRTTDAGKHWKMYQTPLAGHIITEFRDDRTGWVLSKLAPADTGELFKTTDGGRTWKKIPIPKKLYQNGINGLSFITNSTGWLTGSFSINDPDKLSLDQTSDGGAKWVHKQLPTVKGFKGPVTKPLKIFSTHSAILPVQGWLPPGQASQLVFYRTTNQGKSWSPSQVIKPFGMTFAYDFINMKDGWVIDSKNIYTTRDGGKTWSTQPYVIKNTNIPQAYFVILDLEMTSAKTGLMIVQNTNTMTSSILTTNDGGKSWETSNQQKLMTTITND